MNTILLFVSPYFFLKLWAGSLLIMLPFFIFCFGIRSDLWLGKFFFFLGFPMNTYGVVYFIEYEKHERTITTYMTFLVVLAVVSFFLFLFIGTISKLSLLF